MVRKGGGKCRLNIAQTGVDVLPGMIGLGACLEALQGGQQVKDEVVHVQVGEDLLG